MNIKNYHRLKEKVKFTDLRRISKICTSLNLTQEIISMSSMLYHIYVLQSSDEGEMKMFSREKEKKSLDNMGGNDSGKGDTALTNFVGDSGSCDCETTGDLKQGLLLETNGGGSNLTLMNTRYETFGTELSGSETGKSIYGNGISDSHDRRNTYESDRNEQCRRNRRGNGDGDGTGYDVHGLLSESDTHEQRAIRVHTAGVWKSGPAPQKIGNGLVVCERRTREGSYVYMGSCNDGSLASQKHGGDRYTCTKPKHEHRDKDEPDKKMAFQSERYPQEKQLGEKIVLRRSNDQDCSNEIIAAAILLSCKFKDKYTSLNVIAYSCNTRDTDKILKIEALMCEYIDYGALLPELYTFFEDNFLRIVMHSGYKVRDGITPLENTIAEDINYKNEPPIKRLWRFSYIILNDSFYLPFFLYIGKADILRGCIAVARGILESQFCDATPEVEFFVEEMVNFYERYGL